MNLFDIVGPVMVGPFSSHTAGAVRISYVARKIPPDEVIDSMRRIGRQIPACLKETGQEGLAITPTAIEVVKRLR